MREMEINIKPYAIYLISLYYKTGCKYSCTRSKINKLLIIFKLCFIKNNLKTFDNKLIIYENFSYFEDLSIIMEKDVYCTEKSIEENSKIIDKLNEMVEIPPMYKTYIKLAEEEKKLLEIIFREFGNFNINYLSDKIEPIVRNISAIYKNNFILDEDRVFDFFNNYYHEYQNNEIFKFIENIIIKKSNYKNEKNNKIFCDLVIKISNLDVSKQRKLLKYIETFKNDNENFLEFSETNSKKTFIK